MAGQRIVLATIGSLGDLHPFIALALALKARGFAPVVAAIEEYRPKIEAGGLAFHPVRPSIADVTAATGLSPPQITERFMRRSMTHVVRTLIRPFLEDTYQDMLRALDGADLLVASSFSFGAVAAAETAGAPRASLLLSPMLFFSPADPPTIKELPGSGWFHRTFGAPAARLTFGLMRRIARLQQPSARLRRHHRLPPFAGAEIMDAGLLADLVIGLWSPVLAPLPPDAPPGAAVVGFSFYDSEAGGPPKLSPALARFLDSGEPPIVFTLGSFAVNAPGDFFRDSGRAAGRLGRRAVLLVGSDPAPFAGMASDEVFVETYAPHSALFPRACAIVHHGGIGTTAQALRAGRPQLICPVLGDQPDNADRCVRLGVARRLDLPRYAAGRAEALIAALLSDAAAAERAREIGAGLQREDGAAAAAALIAEFLTRRPPAPG